MHVRLPYDPWLPANPWLRQGFLALACCVYFTRPAVADQIYTAALDAAQVVNNPSNTSATGTAQFSLNSKRTHLTYAIQLHGLNLDPIPELRVRPDDVLGIHMHFDVPGTVGPHILNIFGNPSEDDDDLVVNFEENTLTGIFDMSDASRDPKTGNLLPQFFPLTTKLIGDWLDELDAGQLYLAVHTVETAVTPPGVAIRGQIIPVPEPSGLAVWVFLFCGFVRGRKS